MPNPNIPSGTEMLAGIMVIPLIIGLLEVFKGVGLPTKWSPVVSLVLGVLVSVGWAAAAGTRELPQYAQAFLIGLAYGLSASGLYSGLARPAIYKMQQKALGAMEARRNDTEWDKGKGPRSF